MKKKLCGLLLALAGVASVSAVDVIRDDGSFMPNVIDITDELPTIEVPYSNQADANWQFLPDHAQYKGAYWGNCIGIAHNLTAEQAKEYGQNNPDVTYFFYVKGGCMVLENEDVSPAICRIFYHGDAVYFGGNPAETAWWGSAPGLADGYVKLSPLPAK